jgi:ketol-acid reductoisomerase
MASNRFWRRGGRGDYFGGVPDFGGTMEEVITSEEFSKAKEILKTRRSPFWVTGFRVPARPESERQWVFCHRSASGRRSPLTGTRRSRMVLFRARPCSRLRKRQKGEPSSCILLSDAGQMAAWPKVKACLNEGDALYFSHGFSIVYKEQTKVIPPENIDVIMVAPKGSGRSVRANFLDGSGINSSYAVFQDYTEGPKRGPSPLGIAVGSGYLFPTTFREGGAQRPHRRKGRAHGLPGRGDGSPV